MKVGFIGIGRMGRGIAGRILTGEHDLVVYNRTPRENRRAGAGRSTGCGERRRGVRGP